MTLLNKNLILTALTKAFLYLYGFFREKNLENNNLVFQKKKKLPNVLH